MGTICAAGYSRRRAAANTSSDSPNWTKQMPRSVAPIISRPIGDGAEVALGVERTAAFAGAEAIALGLRGSGVEAHVFAQRAARRARRAAVDAGGHHAEEEVAVEAAIVPLDRLPTLLLVDHNHRLPECAPRYY